jgi:hypothetical protein
MTPPIRALVALALALPTTACTSSPAPCDACGELDAHVLDTSAPDAPAADVGVDAPATDAAVLTGCAAHDYLFCEDWESATSSALPAGWTVGGGWMDGEPTITTDQHHTGTHALRSAMAHAGQHRAEHALDALGAAAGHHWGRVFYRVATPAFVPPSGTVIHDTMIALLGEDECRVVDTVVSDRGDHQFLLNIPDDTCCVGSGYDYHSFDGAWHCAEWYVDDTADSYRFFFDGTEVTSIAYTGTNGVPIESFTRIAVGLRNYQDAAMPYDSFFDDLALDDERIGCD